MNEQGALIAYMLLPLGCIFIYLLPWFIASARNTQNRSWVAILDVLFGWTVICWFVSLAMACEGKKRSSHG